MKLTLEATTQIVEMSGVRCRVWEGKMEDGTPIVAFVVRVAVEESEPAEVHEKLERELRACRVPTVVWPARVML